MIGQGQSVLFLINLVQDVNILRPLVHLAKRETEASIGLLISDAFIKRDQQKIWEREIAALARETNASVYFYGNPQTAHAVLSGGSGMIFAASESRLPNHHETSGVFLTAPPGYLRITLQHGFECIGFVQSREHILSHGRNVSFEADVVCSWFNAASLTSLTASERPKLYVTGPSTLLQRSPTTPNGDRQTSGLICENMHSVRLRASGDHKASFMETFGSFCAVMAARGETVDLRPHPGGQYVLKNKVALPPNVQINMRPLYAFDMKRYRYGISAPSTIIFDMVLAGIPVAVWRDPSGIMDASNYDGLTEISTLPDWLAFERDVRLRPQMILDRQAEFLGRLALISDPNEVYRRFARLIVAALAGERTDCVGVRSRAESQGEIRQALPSGDSLVQVSDEG